MSALRVAIAGLGTVGAGVVEILQRNGDAIAARCGRRILVTDVSARDRTRDRGVSLDGIRWHDDPVAMAQAADVDVVVEVIGGAEGAARATVEAAIAAGKDVVTANKALLAAHGQPVAAAAEAAGRVIAYEAAVAGGIPVVKALREGLAGNRVTAISGILNGTCNFILSTMRETGRDFDDVLSEAQDLGYAEADPTFDIDGLDAAHKLSILAAVAFGVTPDPAAISVEGIRNVSAADIEFAQQLGYRIKLLGVARLTPEGVEQRVYPCMVPERAPLALIDGVTNAVMAEGDAVGTIVLSGPGAGRGATASAVVADLVDLACGRRTTTFGIPATTLRPVGPADLSRHKGPYYLRLMVTDRPGVIARIATALGQHDVSIESVLQRGRDPGETVPVVMVTHETRESAIRATIEEIAALDVVVEPPRMLRIEAF